MAAPAANLRDSHIGTSGWTYDDWDGAFYPPGVKGAERLSHYATRFDTVEVNASFYRFPTQAMIGAWNRRLGESFHLVLKGTRRVTHFQRLRDCEATVAAFWERVVPLTRLKVLLWQLPPSLHRDVPLLEDFLAMLPGGVRHAVEFRHESWWDDAVVAALAARDVAMVAVSHPGLPRTVHPTGSLLYLRFHGLGRERYRYDYSEAELRDWVALLQPHLAGRKLYAFFNNDFAAHAPRNAETFRALLAEGS